MARPGEIFHQRRDEPSAEILVEEQLHRSTRQRQQHAFAMRREREARPDVVAGEFGIVRQDLVDGHARCEPARDVLDGDAHPPDAGTTAPLARLDGDASLQVHEGANPGLGGRQSPAPCSRSLEGRRSRVGSGAAMRLGARRTGTGRTPTTGRGRSGKCFAQRHGAAAETASLFAPLLL